MVQQTDWRYCAKCHAMYFDGYPAKGTCPAGGPHSAAGFNFGLPHDIPETPRDQSAWRFCQKCSVLFFDGYPTKGHCPVDGHVAAGFNFVLPHDVPETPKAQAAWRFCVKCNGMYFDGYADKGHCQAGGGHQAAGFDFVLPHDVLPNNNAQDAWRYCGKCHLMFFDGYPAKGACPAGGAHAAIGYMFVLPHDIAATPNSQNAWRFCQNCNAIYFDGYPLKGRCPAAGHQAAGFNFVLPHDIPDNVLAQSAWRFCQKCDSLFFDGFPDKGTCQAGGGHQAAGFNFVLPHSVTDLPTAQGSWRYCGKCQAMFFDGFQSKGVCPSGGAHTAAGFLFTLQHSTPETPKSQSSWRFCHKCDELFFNGYPDKGPCAAGGGHEAAGLTFCLPHDLGEKPSAQANWRYCNKCHVMFYDGFPGKGTCPGGGGHVAAGYNFDLQHDLRDPFVFTTQLISGGLAALGGWATVTIYPDGTVRWQGHAHDSGADGYDFSISAVVTTPFGHSVAVAHSGHVGGTFTSGSRDHDWDETYPNQVSAFALEFAFGELHTNLQYTSDFLNALESLVDWAIKFTIGSIAGPEAGFVVFLGVELGSLISTGSLVPGARIVEGVLWMAGPANTLFAIAAAGIGSIGSKTRDITQEWYDWANAQVYLGSLPPRDKLVLSDTIGPGNRAFTFPRFDGKIVINMGSAGFDDPRNYPTGVYGQTFIHELLHTCQIQYTKMSLSLLAAALAAKVCEVTGGHPYDYPAAGFDYTGMGLEQQAQIVSDWYAGNVPAGTNQSTTPRDTNSPYFGYITNNVRTRNL